MLEHYLAHWNLTPDGNLIETRSSTLLPVRLAGEPAMLKIAHSAEERSGGLLLIWWAGDGAVRVLAHHNEALLMERPLANASLTEMARDGHDDEASRIMCSVVDRLHTARTQPPPPLLSLSDWFGSLAPAAARHGGILKQAAAAAAQLLATPQDIGVLHGDIHHGNILDAGKRGWLAIDPKCLIGERAFDFANLFCNPDLEVATTPGRLWRQAQVVSEAAGLDRNRLLQWVLAWAGLSAAWKLQDGEDPALQLAVAELAASELAKS